MAESNRITLALAVSKKARDLAHHYINYKWDSPAEYIAGFHPLTSYATDAMIDAEWILTRDIPTSMLWIVGESGTYLFNLLDPDHAITLQHLANGHYGPKLWYTLSALQNGLPMFVGDNTAAIAYLANISAD